MSQPYLSLEAELHDAFWESEDPSSELKLMADFLRDYRGIALEVGSGSGRLMLPLIQQGFNIEGLELSPDMVAIHERKADELNISTTVHQGDMSSWQAPYPYTALLAPAFTLQLARDPEQTLKHWHSLMKTNAGLYLTVFMPFAELEGELPENEWYEDHETTLPRGQRALLTTRHRIDHEQKTIHREHRYSIDGDPSKIHESKQSIRWIDHTEMLSLLEKCGFELKRHCFDFTGMPILDTMTSDDCTGIFTYRAEKAD